MWENILYISMEYKGSQNYIQLSLIYLYVMFYQTLFIVFVLPIRGHNQMRVAKLSLEMDQPKTMSNKLTLIYRCWKLSYDILQIQETHLHQVLTVSFQSFTVTWYTYFNCKGTPEYRNRTEFSIANNGLNVFCFLRSRSHCRLLFVLFLWPLCCLSFCDYDFWLPL
jgi:hypothetical protein